MNDNESEEENTIQVKKEPVENSVHSKKPGPLSKKKAAIIKEEPTDLMLTADKMMNKELTLLHAPVVMDDKAKPTPYKGPVTRHSKVIVVIIQCFKTDIRSKFKGIVSPVSTALSVVGSNLMCDMRYHILVLSLGVLCVCFTYVCNTGHRNISAQVDFIKERI